MLRKVSGRVIEAGLERKVVSGLVRDSATHLSAVVLKGSFVYCGMVEIATQPPDLVPANFSVP